MKLIVTERNTCRICGSDRLVRFLELPHIPLADDFLQPGELGTEFLAPLRIYWCERCGLVQTLHDVDVREYYQDYRYSVALSPFAQNFMRRLAEQVYREFQFKPEDTVIEIGSGDGAQLAYFQTLGARVLGFEPSALLTEKSRRLGIPVIQGLFNKESYREIPSDMTPAQVILLTYTFDHLFAPLDFLRTVHRFLDPEQGVLVIEVHDLEKIFERREFCLFAHEHTTYYTAARIQKVLDQAGFGLVRMDLVPEIERRGNSLVVVAALQGSKPARRSLIPPVPAEFSRAQHYIDFGHAVEASLSRFRAFIQSKKQEGKRLAGYGAGGRGALTLASVAEPGDFAYVCDKNPVFHGTCTPGAHVPVVEPERLLHDPVDEVVVFSFGYFQEIYQELVEYRQRGGHLISLLDLL